MEGGLTMETSLSRQQTMEYLRIASELETSVYAQESFLKKLRETAPEYVPIIESFYGEEEK